MKMYYYVNKLYKTLQNIAYAFNYAISIIRICMCVVSLINNSIE